MTAPLIAPLIPPRGRPGANCRSRRLGGPVLNLVMVRRLLSSLSCPGRELRDQRQRCALGLWAGSRARVSRDAPYWLRSLHALYTASASCPHTPALDYLSAGQTPDGEL